MPVATDVGQVLLDAFGSGGDLYVDQVLLRHALERGQRPGETRGLAGAVQCTQHVHVQAGAQSIHGVAGLLKRQVVGHHGLALHPPLHARDQVVQGRVGAGANSNEVRARRGLLDHLGDLFRLHTQSHVRFQLLQQRALQHGLVRGAVLAPPCAGRLILGHDPPTLVVVVRNHGTPVRVGLLRPVHDHVRVHLVLLLHHPVDIAARADRPRQELVRHLPQVAIKSVSYLRLSWP